MEYDMPTRAYKSKNSETILQVLEINVTNEPALQIDIIPPHSYTSYCLGVYTI